LLALAVTNSHEDSLADYDTLPRAYYAGSSLESGVKMANAH